MNKSADIRILKPCEEQKSRFFPWLTRSVFFTLSTDRRSEVGIISWEKSWAGANIWRWPHVASDRQLVRCFSVLSSSFLCFSELALTVARRRSLHASLNDLHQGVISSKYWDWDLNVYYYITYTIVFKSLKNSVCTRPGDRTHIRDKICHGCGQKRHC